MTSTIIVGAANGTVAADGNINDAPETASEGEITISSY